MLNDYQDYLNALEAKQITRHKEALKFFNVRYSSFIQNYPKESPLPACTLAQNGFYFDDTTRSIRCSECEFQYFDLNNELLISILTAHVKFTSSCEQAKLSLENALENDLDLSKTLESSAKIKTSPIKPIFMGEENRLKTFENTRLLFDVKKLASNGFYRVVSDTLKTPFKKTTDSLSSSSNPEPEPSYIELISHSVPALYHIKCAFCSYECLLFRNSLLNTMYKSPFDEHKEKSFNFCQIFMQPGQNKMDWTYTSPSSNHQNLDSLSLNNLSLSAFNSNEVKPKLEWLQALYDFDSIANENITDMLVNPFVSHTSDLDDLEIKKIPKVIDQLVMVKLNIKANVTQSVSNTASANTFLYVPTSAQTQSAVCSKTTSDYNQLQNVLNQSENVMSDKACHPAYSLYQARLDSFKDWPATLSQQPADLAKAGFYYFGIKDMVKCFFCNGGLKNWDHNDDPFQDHVRWFPKCQFIRQLMGYEYIQQIKEKFKNMDSGFTNDPNSNSQMSQSGSSSLISGLPANSPLVHKYQQNKNKRSVSPRTLNSRLDTFIIRKILDTNILTRDSLKQSIEIKLSVQETSAPVINSTAINTPSVYGDDFRSPVDMVVFAYDIERAKKHKLDLFNSISDFMICNFGQMIKNFNIREFISLKYGVCAESVRVIREQGLAENRSFCFVTLRKDDKSKVDEIVGDLEKSSSLSLISLSRNKNLIVIKTNWLEIEEKIKPLIGKSVDVSTSIEQLQQTGESDQVGMVEVVLREDDERSSETVQEDKSMDVGENSLGKEKMGDDTAMQLYQENERLKNERLCAICLTKEKNVLFLPCAHLTACLDCSFSFQNCPMCRAKIQATVRTFT